jgi:hypothetical protein
MNYTYKQSKVSARTRGREPFADKLHSTKSRGMPFGTECSHYRKHNDYAGILANYGFSSKWDAMATASKMMVQKGAK